MARKKTKPRELKTYTFEGSITISGSLDIEAYSLEEAEEIASSGKVLSRLDKDMFWQRGSVTDWDFEADYVPDDEDD